MATNKIEPPTPPQHDTPETVVVPVVETNVPAPTEETVATEVPKHLTIDGRGARHGDNK